MMRRCGSILSVALWFAMAPGCGTSGGAPQPRMFESPYLPRTQLWAVAPLRNESGSTLADGVRVAEQLSQQFQQVRGMTIVPTNRVLHAMSVLGIHDVQTPQEAHALMQVLRADGVVVGTLTGWHPYNPPSIGVAVQLYLPNPQSAGTADVTTRQLTQAGTDLAQPLVNQPVLPVSQFSFHFDSANGYVLTRLMEYAKGRVPDTNDGSHRRYLLTMDLYSEFVSHELMRGLFRSEWDRLYPQPAPQATPKSNDP